MDTVDSEARRSTPLVINPDAERTHQPTNCDKLCWQIARPTCYTIRPRTDAYSAPFSTVTHNLDHYAIFRPHQRYLQSYLLRETFTFCYIFFFILLYFLLTDVYLHNLDHYAIFNQRYSSLQSYLLRKIFKFCYIFFLSYHMLPFSTITQNLDHYAIFNQRYGSLQSYLLRDLLYFLLYVCYICFFFRSIFHSESRPLCNIQPSSTIEFSSIIFFLLTEIFKICCIFFFILTSIYIYFVLSRFVLVLFDLKK